MSFTIEQKLAALREARDILWNLPGPRDAVCVIPPPIEELDAIIVDYSQHIPTLVKAVWISELKAALAHFTEDRT